jgi:signal transduction histidine kinase
MKLFVKYSRVNIVASILALLLGSIGYYIIIRSVLIHQLDDTLKIEEAEILNFVKTRDKLPEPANYRDQQISFTPSGAPIKRHFLNSTWYSQRHCDNRPFRQLLFSITAGGQTYTVSVAKSEVETEDLLGLIMLITAGMILLLLGTLFLANRLLLRRIWQPFYNTLEAIRQFNLSSRTPLPAAGDSGERTDIDEFRNLDNAMEQMTRKILKDYEMLKNFADNASHEMQTPLAIINSKLDLMIQDQALAERHLRQLQAMYDAVGRLSKLNQSLLLLTKIENNQFTHTDPVDLTPLIEEKLSQFEDLIRARELVVRTDLDKVSLRMNGYLADILLNNLLTNAIRHNQDRGSLSVRLHQGSLLISNTGPMPGFDPATIFDRFTKGHHSDGTGLGLAIVKQICDNQGFLLSYSHHDNVHEISIRFPLQNFTKIGE